MKQIAVILVLLAFGLTVGAQSEETAVVGQDTVASRVKADVVRPERDAGRQIFIDDPMFPMRHRGMGYDVWDVHEGINVRAELSASVGIGSGSPDGVGFGRRIDFLYVSPIKNKWNYSIGATTMGMNWGGYNYNSVGLMGNVNYYPSDKVTLSVTGYKSLMGTGGYRYGGYYDCDFYGTYFRRPFDRSRLDSYLGADLNVKLNNKTELDFHIGTGNWKE